MSITLNVSGKIFKVSCDVICKSQLFNSILTDCIIDNETVINRSPKLFEHVYSYLLDDKYPYPKKYYSELDYYLVPYNMDELFDSNKLWIIEIEKMKNEISELKKNLAATFCTIDDKIVTICDNTNIERKCSFPNCDRVCSFDSQTCNFHYCECCYQSPNKKCKNDVEYGRAYCMEHMFAR